MPYQMLSRVRTRQDEIESCTAELKRLRRELNELDPFIPAEFAHFDWGENREDCEIIRGQIRFTEDRLQWLNSVTDEHYANDDGIPF